MKMNDEEFMYYLEEILQCQLEDFLDDFLDERTQIADKLDAIDVNNINEGYWFSLYAKDYVSRRRDT